MMAGKESKTMTELTYVPPRAEHEAFLLENAKKHIGIVGMVVKSIRVSGDDIVSTMVQEGGGSNEAKI